MEIIHQLTFKSKHEPKLLKLLMDAGIQVKAIDLYNESGQSISVLISESNTIWPLINPYTNRSSILHSYETSFSEQEILEAEWLRIVNVIEKGYPQPKESWVTKPNNYNELCSSCGIFHQIKPFHITKEPILGKNSFMSLTWAADALFAVPNVISVWNESQITGYEPWDVILHKENNPAKSIVQIYIPETTLAGLLNSKDLPQTVCYNCGTIKYSYHRKGKMTYSKSAIPSGIDIVRTNEWFGSGRLSFREILISNRLARILIGNNWSGFKLKVVEVV